MTAPVDPIRLDGHITISFFTEHGRHYAQALQFDLLGSGPSRETALSELRALLEAYIETVFESLDEGEIVRFFNPSAEADWNRMGAGFEDFAIAIEVQPLSESKAVTGVASPIRLQDLPVLRPRIAHLRLEKLASV